MLVVIGTDCICSLIYDHDHDCPYFVFGFNELIINYTLIKYHKTSLKILNKAIVDCS